MEVVLVKMVLHGDHSIDSTSIDSIETIPSVNCRVLHSR